MTFPHGHLDKLKVTGRKSAQFVSGPYVTYKETLEILASHKDCL